MSNAYNVTVPSGSEYPSQKFVDDFLNGIDNLPSCETIQNLLDMGEEAAMEYIRQKVSEMQEKVSAYFSSMSESLTNKMTPLEPLTHPPQSLDDVVSYCSDMAQYFAKPYTQMVDLTTFYSTFAAAAATAIGNKLAELGCLVPPME